MSDTAAVGSEVKAALTIDTDTIEQVHERLIRKGTQNANRAEVIDQARGWLNDNTIQVADYGESPTLAFAEGAKPADLLEILNRDCD